MGSLCVLLTITAALAGGCDSPIEATRVSIPVVADPSQLVAVTTDTGYRVELTSMRLAFRDVVFNVQGEEHVAARRMPLWDWLLPAAYAHPGHYEGGVVTGELLGDFSADWLADEPAALGTATLLPGRYNSFSFTFSYGQDEGNADEDLVGHTAVLEGTATRDDNEIPFTAIIDSPIGRVLTDARTELEIVATTTGTLVFQIHTRSELTDATLFDGIEFMTLPTDTTGRVLLQRGDATTEDAYNTLLRALQSFDFYEVRLAN